MDLRKHPRVPFSGKAKILNTKPQCEVTISNFSAGGLLLHTKKAFNLGQELTIELTGLFKKEPFHEKVSGRVVTLHRKDTINSYGLQFGLYLDADLHPALFSMVTKSKRKKISSFLRD